MTRIAHVQLVSTPGTAGDKLRTRSWIEIRLIGEDDSPIGGEKYSVRLPGGTIVSGYLDADGTARVDDIPPGVCHVSFPELDQDAWTPVTTSTQTAAA